LKKAQSLVVASQNVSLDSPQISAKTTTRFAKTDNKNDLLLCNLQSFLAGYKG